MADPKDTPPPAPLPTVVIEEGLLPGHTPKADDELKTLLPSPEPEPEK